MGWILFVLTLTLLLMACTRIEYLQAEVRHLREKRDVVP